MARVVDRVNPNNKFPLDQWFNGEVWELEQGVDFEWRSDTMQQFLRRAARQRGLRVETHTNQSSIRLQVIREEI